MPPHQKRRIPVMERMRRVCRVLLAEDNPNDIAIVQRAVRKSRVPCQLEIVRDGEQTLAFLRKTGPWQDVWTPDLVILNINMPRMQGLDVLDVMKADPKLRIVPVAVWSITEREEDVTRAILGGCSGMFTKPVVAEEAEAQIRAILEYHWWAWSHTKALTQTALPHSKQKTVTHRQTDAQPQGTQVAVLREDMVRVRRSVDQRQTLLRNPQRRTMPPGELRIAYVDAVAAFNVFLETASDLRKPIVEKHKTIDQLTSAYAQGSIPTSEYVPRKLVLSAEMLRARISTAVGILDRMIASDKFTSSRPDMLSHRKEAQPLIDGIKNLIFAIRLGVMDAVELSFRHALLYETFKKLDAYVTTLATTKLVQAAEKVAAEHNYDLVVRRKNVVLYRDQKGIDDITSLVKAKLQGCL
jgi:CheY-like chemotaxis protein